MCFIGATGSGKTTAIKEILSKVIPLIGTSKESIRCVVYDPKTEFYGYLSQLATCPVYTLHPLDIRSCSWDAAKSVRTPMDEHQFAASIIPVVEGPNAYFSKAAREVVETVLQSFNLHSPGDWTFRDCILGCETERRLRAILSRDESTQSAIQKYLDANEATSILSELDTHLRPFRPIAACWSRARPINLEDFVQGQFILILPMERKARDQLCLLNGLIVNYLSQLLLAQKTNDQLRREGLPERLTFIFLDELRDIAKHLSDLTNFFTLGRAYGISNIIGYQSQEGLIDALDPNRAPKLLGQCHYRGLLPVTENETAEYLSRMCQEKEVYRNSQGGPPQISRETLVLPAAFSLLGSDMLRGYYLAPEPLGL
jgi:type IV secretory pathway TraG/TraD family ATPase VirD4